MTSTDVRVDYLVNEQLLGTETTTAGDIAEGEAGGTLLVGISGDGVGGFENNLPAGTVLDALALDSDAMSPEEIRQEWRRITVHQPTGYRILKSHIPPGEAWSRDPATRVQRWIAAEGDALGFAFSLAERLRDDIFPDRAYREALEAWERITGQATRPGDTVDDRRARVLGFLRKILGFQVDDVKLALEPLFGLLSAQIDIIERFGLRTDSFGTDDVALSSLWRSVPAEGTITVASDQCTLALPAGTRGDYPLGAPRREVSLASNPITRVVDGAAMTTFLVSNPVAGYVAGHLWRGTDNQAVIIGLSAGEYFLLEYPDDLSTAPTITSLGTPAADLTESHLFTRYNGPNSFSWGYAGTGFGGPLGLGALTIADVAANLTDPRWGGIVFAKDDALTTTAESIALKEFQVFEPQSPRGHSWFAFRDPGLGGTYDLDAAKLQIDGQRPAHTYARPLDDLQGALAGSTVAAGLTNGKPAFPHINT